MDFVDSVIVRLGDPASRGAVFDDSSLANLVTAAYDTEAMPMGPPYAAVFDELTVGYAAPPVAVAEGEWMGVGGTDRTELKVRLQGVGQSPLRIDALWRGGLVVRTSAAQDRVEALKISVPSLDVDPDIIAAFGALPTDPVRLEAERRTRVVARLRAGLHQPAAFTDAHLDRLLAVADADSVSALVTGLRDQAATATIQLRYADSPGNPPTPRVLPFAAVVLVRDTGFSLATLLAESRLARTRAEELGLDVPASGDVRRRHRITVAWVVPVTTFDDPDWPGGAGANPEQQRAARIARASQWLATEGIGLVVVA